MNAERCLQILREIKDVAFATVDDKGMPQIRIIDIMLVEGEKVYFCTARGKDFYAQLMRDGNVAVTGMNREYQMISRYLLEQFCFDNGEVEFFDLGREPIVRETFALGGSEKTFKGYEITDKCIQCGKCERICPQKCIKDFVINQTHCLHCGLCFEECPVNAVRKL